MPIGIGSMYQNRAVFGHDYCSTLWPTSTWYPVCVDSTGHVCITGTVTTGTITATVGGTVDVDIKTLGGSVVPAGPLPVDFVGTIIANVSGTLDVDIKTLGGSVVPAGPLPVDIISGGVTGTQDVDIKTLGGSVVPAGPLPVNATCSTVHVDAVTGWFSLEDDIINTMSLWQNVTGTLVYTPTLIHGFDGVDFDRIRTTEAMAGSTLTTGLLAIGEFGYDGSAWRYKRVDASGNIGVTGTVDITGLAGTMDVDIKTIGGSVVASGDLPTSMESYPTASVWSCPSTVVGTVCGQLVAANAIRKSIAIMNHTAGSNLFIGANGCCSTATGWPLQYKQCWMDGGLGVYTGTISGIADAGSIDVRIIETT